MATTKLYTTAGVTILKGEAKARYGTDLIQRVKCFSKDPNQTFVHFIELPKPSTKLEALEILAQHPEFQGNADVEFEIQSRLAEQRKLAKRAEVKTAGTAKVTAVTAQQKTTA